MSNERMVAIILAVSVVVAARIGFNEPPPIELVTVQQGVSVFQRGGDKIFVNRQGTLTIDAWLARAPSGDDLVWCDTERVFLGLKQKDLFDEQGRYVAGPSERDMDRVQVDIEQERTLAFGPVQRAAGRTPDVTLAGEIGLLYDQFDPAQGPPRAPFCQISVR